MICKWCGETLKTGAKTCRRCKREIPAKSDCGGYYDFDLNENGEIEKNEENVLCTTCGSERGVDYSFAQKTRAGLA